MTQADLPRKVYQKHRASQRERILEAAEKLFLSDGIDAVTVGQVARLARMTRMTLYEYFPDKSELAWAVFQKVITELREAALVELAQSGGSGYERLERYLLVRAGSLETHLDQVRYIALFNYQYAREGSSKRMRGALEQAWPGIFDLTAGLIREGIADGSIRPGLDPGLTSAAIGNLLAAIISRFALLGSNIPEEYGYAVKDLYREICSGYLRGLRAA
jgi:AcrR family transcriptional regulator